MSVTANTDKPGILGILGGMGPAATLDFMRILLDLTPAETDQDHIPVITYSNSQIPDRNEAYLRGGTSPVDELVKSAKILENAGSNLIAIPCNTAHIWYPQISAAVGIEVLNMPEISAREIPENATVGIISTTPVRLSGLYSEVIEKKGSRVLLPDDQEKIMEAIYLVKAGKLDDANRLFTEEIRKMEAEGMQYLLEACTEVPLAVKQEDTSATLIDPMEKLALECVRRFGKIR